MRALPATGKVGKPAENAALIHAIRRCDALHCLSLTHRLNGLLPHRLQGVMIEGAPSECPLHFMTRIIAHVTLLVETVIRWRVP